MGENVNYDGYFGVKWREFSISSDRFRTQRVFELSLRLNQMRSESQPWRVVYIASRQEKKVAKRLDQLGIENYLPIARQLRQWSDRKKWVEFPMFNGYLFVRPQPDALDLVVSQTGVVRYLMFDGKHAEVREREIDVIRIIEKSGYYAETILNPSDFEEGESLMVNEGPLKGQEVELIRKNNDHIFLVSFDTLGQSIKVNLPFEFLEKTGEAQ